MSPAWVGIVVGVVVAVGVGVGVVVVVGVGVAVGVVVVVAVGVAGVVGDRPVHPQPVPVESVLKLTGECK